MVDKQFNAYLKRKGFVRKERKIKVGQLRENFLPSKKEIVVSEIVVLIMFLTVVLCYFIL